MVNGRDYIAICQTYNLSYSICITDGYIGKSSSCLYK